MSTNRLNLDQKLQLIMECRKSGLSDRQWCLKQGIPPSTFYTWIAKLKKRACCDIPESESKTSNVTTYAPHQDVVKVNIVPNKVTEVAKTSVQKDQTDAINDNASIVIQMNDLRISIHNSVNPVLLANTLKMLKGLSC